MIVRASDGLAHRIQHLDVFRGIVEDLNASTASEPNNVFMPAVIETCAHVHLFLGFQ